MLTGRSAAVTGAASGIGRAIAAEFVRAGARLHCLDLDGDAVRVARRRARVARRRRTRAT